MKPSYVQEATSTPRREFYYLTDEQMREAMMAYLRSQGVKLFDHERVVVTAKDRNQSYTEASFSVIVGG